MQVLNPRDVDSSCSHLEGHSLYKMFTFYLLHLFVYCVSVECVHANAAVWIRRSEDQLEELVASFHGYNPVVLIRVTFSASNN